MNIHLNTKISKYHLGLILSSLMVLTGIIVLYFLPHTIIVTKEEHQSTVKTNMKITVFSSPIIIDNNTDFAIQAVSNGWSGDGSTGNPYILENLEVTSLTTGTHAISIQNTNVYFIARNNTLSTTESFSSGMYLNNVHNGIIRNNMANSNSDYGFYLESSSNNSFFNNKADSNTNHGFYLRDSSNNTLNNNTANNNNDIGFYIRDSSNNTLNNNTANYNYNGFYLWPSSINNSLSYNTANNNNNYGFTVSSSSLNNVLSYNTANYNLFSGFYLVSLSSNNMLSQNTANYNYRGFYLSATSTNNTLNNNTAISNTQYGLYLTTFSSNNNLSFNYIGNNSLYGIFIDSGSANTRITNNTFVNNNNASTQALSYEGNTIFSFNFWSDHISPDTDSNGIVDTAYVIEGTCTCQDITPVTTPYHKIPDTTAPTITIISPVATTYDTNSVTIIYTISEDVTITVYVDDIITAVTNSSLLEGLSDGIHSLTIKAVDNAGNVASSEVIFTIKTLSSGTFTSSNSNSSSSSTSSTKNTQFTNTSPSFTVTTLVLLGIILIPVIRYKRRKH
ncbi:MAG: hypothetical protein HeimC3_50840 [Candidatus Heimdallarchaeota archaeon LC_3]|nr:MAG: hypothetical protein HeimC3_50840 [Candidatus Heimdallarchaeota archaeon LC_3]